ncbi:MAG: hypothetical protein LC648_09545 [Novosphingobium sp.]|nr:hypothetical protein [Novosphingobium sp.]
MTRIPRDDDSALIDEAAESAGGGQGSASGGNLAREVGARDEIKTAGGADPQPTSVDKRDQPDDGDLPTPRETRS